MQHERLDMSIVKEGYLRHYSNGSWEDFLVKLHSSGKLELVTLLVSSYTDRCFVIILNLKRRNHLLRSNYFQPKTVACKSFHLGPLSIAATPESSTSLMMWGGVDQVFSIKMSPGSKNKPELFAVEKSKVLTRQSLIWDAHLEFQERRRWIEMINFITLRNALQLKHPHPLTAVISDRRTYLQKILKSSVLPFKHGTIVCANCQTPAEQEGKLNGNLLSWKLVRVLTHSNSFPVRVLRWLYAVLGLSQRLRDARIALRGNTAPSIPTGRSSQSTL